MDTELREGWHWPTYDKAAWEWCYERWKDLPDKILKYVHDFDLCVHAGANVGLYAKQYAALFQRVVAVEPEPTNFWCLTQNVPEPNVAKLQAVLGKSHGWCGLQNRFKETNCGGWSVGEGHLTPILKIDDFHGEVGLIHLDVEGYELEVLKGASETLYYQSPIVCLETVGHGPDCLSFLRQFGYEIAEVLEHDTIYRK